MIITKGTANAAPCFFDYPHFTHGIWLQLVV